MAGVAVRQQTSPLPLEGIIPVFHQPEDGVEDTTVSTVKSEKARRRSSLLVSRFGQVRHSWSPSIGIMVLNGLYPFQTQTPENPVDIALGQTGVSRAASAVSSLVLKSPLYAQPPVSFRLPGGDHGVFIRSSHLASRHRVSTRLGPKRGPTRPALSMTTSLRCVTSQESRRSPKRSEGLSPDRFPLGDQRTTSKWSTHRTSLLGCLSPSMSESWRPANSKTNLKRPNNRL